MPLRQKCWIALSVAGAGLLLRLGVSGLVLIRHGVGQPAMQFRIGSRDVVLAWEPPSQVDRRPSAGALRISAAWQAAACRWSCAIVSTWQSADGIEWCTLTDETTGELVARAVLAEDGRDLYAEDDRQTEIPGSRTAGSIFDRTVRDVARDLRDGLRAAGVASVTSTVGGVTRTTHLGPEGAATAEAPDEEPVIEVDGKPVEAAPAEAEAAPDDAPPEIPTVDVAPTPTPTPTPVPDDTRVWIPEAGWDELSPDAYSTVTALFGDNELGGRVGWITGVAPGGALRSLEALAARLNLPLHLGDEPPATGTVAV